MGALASSEWMFDAPGVVATVAAAPAPDSGRPFFEAAVPQLCRQLDPLLMPCMVTARVLAPAPMGRARPAGPRGRAKALLDALHDQRRTGPMYAELGAKAPLADDGPGHVQGLAVEVRPAQEASVEYRLGAEVVVAGDLVTAVEVDAEAPNDIAGTAAEQAKIERARQAFGRAVSAAWHEAPRNLDGMPAALVIRHRPGRDEDNTWETWIAALIGKSRWAAPLWDTPSPLASWAPEAVASIADPNLDCAVRYELYLATAGSL